MIQPYVAKISGPLLDRSDIHIEVPAVRYKELRNDKVGDNSAEIRDRALHAKTIQQQRFASDKNVYANSQMTPKLLRQHCAINDAAEKQLEVAITRMGLSARAHDRILKVARTIADLGGSPSIESNHIGEAIQ